MERLVPYVDVLIANEEDAKDVFGIEAENTDILSGKLNREGYIDVAQKLTERFGCKAVAITLRVHKRERKRLGRYALYQRQRVSV